MSPIENSLQKTSEKTNFHIEGLLEEVRLQSQIFTGVSPGNPALTKIAETEMELIAKTRGRPLYYPYIGSGRGRGPFVELIDGSVKLDLICGIGIHLMGHSHPVVIEASLRGALSDVVMQGNLQPNKEYTEFSNLLLEKAKKQSSLAHVWLATCGTMANENALKIARQKNSPARFILACVDAFAGRSTMMAEITDNKAYKVGLPEYNEVLRVPFLDTLNGGKNRKSSQETALRVLKEHVAKHENNISCFVFEPMQGEGGYKAGSKEFFEPMLSFCREKKIAVWADEVQTFTRTGELFAFETLGIGSYIDICTIAKTAQVGATLYTSEYNPKPGLIAGTFSGSSSSLAAGSAILRYLSEGNYFGPNGRIQSIHKRFVEGLNQLNSGSCKDQLTDAGGLGLMIAVTPFKGEKESTEKFLKDLFNAGLMAFGCGKDPYRIRFLVPAIIQDKEIDLALSIIEKTVLDTKKTA